MWSNFFFFKKIKGSYIINKNDISVSSSVILSFTKTNKEYFFNSIKNCFLFKEHTSGYLDNFYSKYNRIRSYVIYAQMDFFNDYTYDEEGGFFFFDQFRIFYKKQFNVKGIKSAYILNFFKKDKYFFKKVKNVNSIFTKCFFNARSFLSFFYKSLPYGTLMSGHLRLGGALLNNRHVKNNEDFNLKVGDTIKLIFSKKIIEYFLRNNFYRLNWSLKNNNLSSFSKNDSTLSSSFVNIKDRLYSKKIIKMGSMSLSDLEFNPLSFCLVKVFSVNLYRNSFFIKRFINVFSWRLYEWDRK